jgi:hypothetical protein
MREHRPTKAAAAARGNTASRSGERGARSPQLIFNGDQAIDTLR